MQTICKGTTQPWITSHGGKQTSLPAQLALQRGKLILNILLPGLARGRGRCPSAAAAAPAAVAAGAAKGVGHAAPTGRGSPAAAARTAAAGPAAVAAPASTASGVSAAAGISILLLEGGIRGGLILRDAQVLRRGSQAEEGGHGHGQSGQQTEKHVPCSRPDTFNAQDLLACCSGHACTASLSNGKGVPAFTQQSGSLAQLGCMLGTDPCPPAAS